MKRDANCENASHWIMKGNKLTYLCAATLEKNVDALRFTHVCISTGRLFVLQIFKLTPVCENEIISFWKNNKEIQERMLRFCIYALLSSLEDFNVDHFKSLCFLTAIHYKNLMFFKLLYPAVFVERAKICKKNEIPHFSDRDFMWARMKVSKFLRENEELGKSR